jgi:Uri superfamily endonuclease
VIVERLLSASLAVCTMNAEIVSKYPLESSSGTYALLLALDVPTEIEVGSLGGIQFESPFYMYVGSAFGPGGLGARVKHHAQPIRRAHWHIDYLRQAADVISIWYSAGSERFECTWASAALELHGASAVPLFGSSDCRCSSHLFGLSTLPNVASFRRQLVSLKRGCPPIRQLQPSSSVSV